VLLPGGGWVFLGFLQALLVFWLVMGVATVFAAARFRRRMQRQWQQFQEQYQPWYWPTGHSQH
jgi:membrane protein implicated in regulation of membrane protease activity